MMKPRLLYAKDESSMQVACVASLVPTFDPPAPQEEMEVLHDQEPQMIELMPGSDFHFIFIVDRSGSMQLHGRMQQARDALKIFIQSLPTNCEFSIISFGSYVYQHYYNQYANIPYSETTKDYALKMIDQFAANFGATDIRTPLSMAQ